ncbi:M6 family metalloprotease domain-containing protein [Prevotella sp.]|uniref:M6 family metalloprotease domain-containing protein n=1 Tax=Prevotella sp. TaxID=59823 RepID=UPI003DA44A20
MRKIALVMYLFAITMMTFSIPVMPGRTKRINIGNNKVITAELCGDESFKYWQSANGEQYEYMPQNGIYAKLSNKVFTKRINIAIQKRTMRMLNSVKTTRSSTGNKKALVILVNFQDTHFKETSTLDLYDKILNQTGFRNQLFNGSAHDYFMNQSNGLFNLSFDIAGPVTLAHPYAYYGANNDSNGDDAHPEEMVIEACKAIANTTNFSKYDWDGDGEVEQVFIVYAGHGEADYDNTNLVWPHKWALSASSYNKVLKIGGEKINVYACASELNSFGSISGIGAFCHEFSHCLGLPDMYNTKNTKDNGIGYNSLMAAGSYLGGGYCPCGYSAYEKTSCGWISPKTLNNDTIISNLNTTINNGEAYIIYNDANNDEYYIIENRQRTGWDKYLPNSGMLAMHIDYSKEDWENNTVNSETDHHRISAVWVKDSLTANSVPSADIYTKGKNGSNHLNMGLNDINSNSDSTINFVFKRYNFQESEVAGDTLFHESFDKCMGKGGNDNNWTGHYFLGRSFNPDHKGWSNTNVYSGYKCAKFGTTKISGTTASPEFYMNGKAILTFRVATFDNDDKSLDVHAGNTSFSMLENKSGKWTSFSFDFEYSGKTVVEFVTTGRLIIDDVAVVKSKENRTDTGLTEIDKSSDNMHQRIYNMMGQCVGNNIASLPNGIYIKDGKKFLISK